MHREFNYILDFKIKYFVNNNGSLIKLKLFM